MKFSAALLACGLARGGLGAAVRPRDVPTANKVENMEPKFFKELGAKRVKITYGPYVVPGIEDKATHGMKSFTDMRAVMPCTDCLITATIPNLVFDDGSTANANMGMWLHHIGLGNWGRADVVCPTWPDRFLANGNERSNVDLTLGGTRKVGYYFAAKDTIMLATEVMNESALDRTVFLTLEWEYLPGIPEGFDLDVPIWLDVKGDCPVEAGPLVPKTDVFNATRAKPWSPKFTGDLFLMTSHVHDGNINQQVFLDGKMICDSVANYGESSGYISHVGEFGHEKKPADPAKKAPEHEHGAPATPAPAPAPEHEHGTPAPAPEHEHGTPMPEHEHPEGEPAGGHDHNTDEHIAHISSTTECKNLGKISPESKLSLTSYYDMTKHSAMLGHDGGLEPIMAIQWMHAALSPKDEAMKKILAAKTPDNGRFGPGGAGLHSIFK